MAYSKINAIELCNVVSINSISRDGTNKFLGQTKGLSCTREPIVSDGPVLTKDIICTDPLDREPTGDVKFSTDGAPGDVKSDALLTKGDSLCSPETKLEEGWYIFFGEFGEGYDGYQIINMDGSADCKPAEITTCS